MLYRGDSGCDYPRLAMQMMPLVRTVLALGLLSLAACGGQSTDSPTGLLVTTYPAGQAFTMSLTMQACSDVCAEYDEGSCSVDVKADENVLDVNASLSWDRKVSESECDNRCGPPKFVHCAVPALSAGTYTVKSGQFSKDIVVR